MPGSTYRRTYNLQLLDIRWLIMIMAPMVGSYHLISFEA